MIVHQRRQFQLAFHQILLDPHPQNSLRGVLLAPPKRALDLAFDDFLFLQTPQVGELLLWALLLQHLQRKYAHAAAKLSLLVQTVHSKRL